MDNYNELLVRKNPGAKEFFLRGLIIVLSVGILGFTVFAGIMFNFLALILIGVGACYLGFYLIGFTMIEYEYIITNSDFDVDKVIGKRSRKRLISINLNQASEWGEYNDNVGNNVNATVIATDNLGTNIWYLIASHDKIGTVMLLFSPENELIRTINKSVPYSLRKRLAEPEADEEATPEE